MRGVKEYPYVLRGLTTQKIRICIRPLLLEVDNQKMECLETGARYRRQNGFTLNQIQFWVRLES